VRDLESLHEQLPHVRWNFTASGEPSRRRGSADTNLEIDVETSDDPCDRDDPTVLVLPEDLTEEARLALIDLDVVAEGVRGTTMHWNPDTGAWEQVEDDQA
jgi:hypothetical protein